MPNNQKSVDVFIKNLQEKTQNIVAPTDSILSREAKDALDRAINNQALDWADSEHIMMISLAINPQIAIAQTINKFLKISDIITIGDSEDCNSFILVEDHTKTELQIKSLTEQSLVKQNKLSDIIDNYDNQDTTIKEQSKDSYQNLLLSEQNSLQYILSIQDNFKTKKENSKIELDKKIQNLKDGEIKELKGMTLTNDHWSAFEINLDDNNRIFLTNYNSLGGNNITTSHDNKLITADGKDASKESYQENSPIYEKFFTAEEKANITLINSQDIVKQRDSISCAYLGLYNLNKNYFNNLGITNTGISNDYRVNSVGHNNIREINNNPDSAQYDIFYKQVILAEYILSVKYNIQNLFHEAILDSVNAQEFDPTIKDTVIGETQKAFKESFSFENTEGIDVIYNSVIKLHAEKIKNGRGQDQFNMESFNNDLKNANNIVMDIYRQILEKFSETIKEQVDININVELTSAKIDSYLISANKIQQKEINPAIQATQEQIATDAAIAIALNLKSNPINYETTPVVQKSSANSKASIATPKESKNIFQKIFSAISNICSSIKKFFVNLFNHKEAINKTFTATSVAEGLNKAPEDAKELHEITHNSGKNQNLSLGS